MLILDDFGLEPLGASERKELLEVLEDRYGSGATVVTSQLEPKDWHAVIGEPTLADAILDRLWCTTPIGSSSRARRCATLAGI